MKSLCLLLMLWLPLAAQEIYQIAAEAVTDGQILLDGRLEETVWRKSESTGYFTGVMGASQIGKTSARFLYSGKGLYLGIVSEIPADFQLKKGIGMFSGERVEFILKPFPDEMTYYLFTVNANGDREEACFGSPDFSDPMAFQGEWKSEIQISKGSWQAEIFIPYSMLNVEMPEANISLWKTNICRGEGLPSGDRYSAWNPKFSGFHYAGCTITFK